MNTAVRGGGGKGDECYVQCVVEREKAMNAMYSA